MKVGGIELQFITNVKAAFVEVGNKFIRRFTWGLMSMVFILLVWANLAEIDQLTRGQGQVIPDGQVQMIQNLEGGIVREILVQEGDLVSEGQVLLKMDDLKSRTMLKEKELQLMGLLAKKARLESESDLKKTFTVSQKLKESIPEIVAQEFQLFQTIRKRIKTDMDIISEKVKQKKSVYSETLTDIKHTETEYKLITRELSLKKPLVLKGITPETEYLAQKRTANDVKKRLNQSKAKLFQVQTEISSLKKEIDKIMFRYRKESEEELSDVLVVMEQTKNDIKRIEDEVRRRDVKSSTSGTVKQVLVNTVGGVVQPGDKLLEIVPETKKVILEVKIKPSDIGFLHRDMHAVIKFTAYDYSIYGTNDGKVINISADSIRENDESFYLVKIEVDHEVVDKRNGQHLDIIPGMTADVDIMTGKKTIMNYILKPIFKSADSALSER
jgi:adhesin transport system membrane fusion protein